MKAIKIILIFLVIVLVVALAGIYYVGPQIARNIILEIMSEELRAEVELESVEFSLIEGRASIHGLVIKQAEEFQSEYPALEIKNFSAKLDLHSLTSDKLIIDELNWQGGVSYIARSADGISSVEVLFPDPNENPQQTTDIAELLTDIPIKSILIRKVQVSDVTLYYLDDSLSEEGALALTLTNITADAENLILFKETSGERLPGRASIRVDIAQGEKADAYVGLRLALGSLGLGFPETNAVLVLSGLHLDTLTPLIPAGSSQALGGEILDMEAQAKMASDSLNIQSQAHTAGANFELLITGTPEEPVLEDSGLFFDVMIRGLGGLGNLMGNIGTAGVETVKGIGKGGVAIAKGAGGVIESVGGGLFSIFKGTVTADVDEMSGGMEQMTKGTVDEVGGAVKDTAGEVGEGVSSAASGAVGGHRKAGWSDEQLKRWDKKWQDSATQLENMPYQSATKKSEKKTKVEKPRSNFDIYTQ